MKLFGECMKIGRRFIVFSAIECVVLHDIVPYEFVLYEGWILKRALFCGIPRIRVLVATKETFFVLVEGCRWR
jgi:hypothetical protein